MLLRGNLPGSIKSADLTPRFGADLRWPQELVKLFCELQSRAFSCQAFHKAFLNFGLDRPARADNLA